MTVREAYESGQSLRMVGDAFGLHPDTVRRMLIK